MGSYVWVCKETQVKYIKEIVGIVLIAACVVFILWMVLPKEVGECSVEVEGCDVSNY